MDRKRSGRITEVNSRISGTKREYAFDALCRELGITHKLIRPRTPWHNGKVERSHGNDQECFCNRMKFYSYDDLKTQMKAYLRRSNNAVMAVLGRLSPIEKRQSFLAAAPQES